MGILGFRVSGFGLRVSDFGSRVEPYDDVGRHERGQPLSFEADQTPSVKLFKLECVVSFIGLGTWPPFKAEAT